LEKFEPIFSIGKKKKQKKEERRREKREELSEQMGDQFPVQGLASHHVTIAGEQAILACTLFRNKLLILLTHTGRVASWVRAPLLSSFRLYRICLSSY
tara:strand:- start:36 stop:329 length:294 start_codon:yes stop_codon:yes gene_type:complete